MNKSCIECRLKNSLLVPSGTEVYFLEGKYGNLSLEVHGDIRVHFKGETYSDPREYPELLKRVISFGDTDWYEATMNNWYEWLYIDKQGNIIESDVADVDGEDIDTVIGNAKATLEQYEDYWHKEKDND